MVPGWAHAIKGLPTDANPKKISEVYGDKATPSPSLFDDLLDHMHEWDYTTTSQKKKIRAVLGLLSADLNSRANAQIRIEDTMRTRKVQGENHPWELEHVAPQSKNSTGVFQSIGNLGLLSSADNNNLTSDLPEKKVDHYKKCSLLLTNTVASIVVPNSKQSEVIGDLLNALDIREPGWDLMAWDADSITSRTNFYHRYFTYLIKSVGL
jgi:hypothetical protein